MFSAAAAAEKILGPEVQSVMPYPAKAFEAMRKETLRMAYYHGRNLDDGATHRMAYRLRRWAWCPWFTKLHWFEYARRVGKVVGLRELHDIPAAVYHDVLDLQQAILHGYEATCTIVDVAGSGDTFPQSPEFNLAVAVEGRL